MRQDKKQLRAHMQQLSQRVDRRQQGLAVVQHLTASLRRCSSSNQHSCRIALFVSLSDEIDLSMLYDWLQQHSWQYFIPYTVGEDLIFAPAQTNKHRLPDSNTSVGNVVQCCLLLVPGLAFDRLGNRLGRGKGYYDRFLSRLRQEPSRPLIVGVCMQHQLLERVPMQQHDQQVDAICTPALGLLRCLPQQ